MKTTQEQLNKKLERTHKLFEKYKVEDFALTMKLLNEYRLIWDIR